MTELATTKEQFKDVRIHLTSMKDSGEAAVHIRDDDGTVWLGTYADLARIVTSRSSLESESADANKKHLEIILSMQGEIDEAESENARLREALRVAEIVEPNLADYARRYFELFDLYLHSWLRNIGGVIRPKHHQIDGFALRTQDIYEKAKLVDRIKVIMCDELKKKASAQELFDAVFKMLAEDRHDKVPTN